MRLRRFRYGFAVYGQSWSVEVDLWLLHFLVGWELRRDAVMLHLGLLTVEVYR